MKEENISTASGKGTTYFTEESKMETYKVKVICDNCTQEQEIEIPYGVKVGQNSMNNRCSNCKCVGTLYLKGSW